MLKDLDGMKLNFQGSILGFEELNEFILEIISDTLFVNLKSTENEDISFVATSPFDWYTEYSLTIDEPLKNKLNIEKPEDVLVLCIVTIRETLETSTINLAAPLIIHDKQKKGLQHVVQDAKYRANSLLISNPEQEGEVGKC
ncbi:Flagellar assembly factor FliW [compost metagenome]|nr:hypothetical protein [Paenibacillus timonensis]